MKALTEIKEQTEHKGEASELFLTYMRTMQIFKQRLRRGDPGPFVHIPTKLIENTFFVYPKYDRKHELRKLYNAGKIDVEKRQHEGRSMYVYRCLVPGPIDASLIETQDTANYSPIHFEMREMLRGVSLPAGSPSTLYFDTFLKNKELFLNVFFRVCTFASRVHTPVTNFHRTHRPNILLDGSPTISFDVGQMQPLILGKILSRYLPGNEFSAWIEAGHDVYVMLQQKAGLESRDKGKKRFYEILFNDVSTDLTTLFGNSDWINFVNTVKKRPNPQNPRYQVKDYSNMAWLLQRAEAEMMCKVWELLYQANIKFLSVHDEIILKAKERHKGEAIIRSVLDREFTRYQLNSK